MSEVGERSNDISDLSKRPYARPSNGMAGGQHRPIVIAIGLLKKCWGAPCKTNKMVGGA